jgi:hypothetical protein
LNLPTKWFKWDKMQIKSQKKGLFYPIFRLFALTCLSEKTIAAWDGSGKPLSG